MNISIYNDYFREYIDFIMIFECNILLFLNLFLIFLCVILYYFVNFYFVYKLFLFLFTLNILWLSVREGGPSNP